MKPAITIRDETEVDIIAIAEITVTAFKTLAISLHTEQFIIQALRAADALSLSLVAEADGQALEEPYGLPGRPGGKTTASADNWKTQVAKGKKSLAFQALDEAQPRT